MDLNLISVLISVLIPFMVVYLFHMAGMSKYLFGNEDGVVEIRKTTGIRNVLLTIFAGLFLSFFLLQFCNEIGQEGQFDTFGHGAWHGGFAAVFIALPIILVNGIFRRHKAKTILIQWIFWFVTLALMGGVMDAMNHWPNEAVM